MDETIGTMAMPHSENITQPNPQAIATVAMVREIEMLREAIVAARQNIQTEEGDLAKTGALLARLTDSLGRALLVQQKLEATAGNSATAQADRDLDDMLREWKEGEEGD